MCGNKYVIFIIATATLCQATSTVETSRNTLNLSPKIRRFLVNNFCTLFCPINCQYGYVRSTSGCYLCQCASSVVMHPATLSQPYTTVGHFLRSYSPVIGGVLLNKPCNPAVRLCRLQCTQGYLEGTNGCQHCLCNFLVTNSTAKTYITTTTTTVVHQALTTPSHPLSTLLAAAASNNSKRPSFIRKTTPIPVKVDLNFKDPCFPSQKTCDKPCDGYYVKGPGGCVYCYCESSIPPELRVTTTIEPALVPGQVTMETPVPHYLDLSPTSKSCIMAKVICNYKCEHGFISHPGDCLYCSCQKHNTANDDSDELHVTVTLPNPCVEQQLDLRNYV